MSLESQHLDLAGILAEVNGGTADERAQAHLAFCADCQRSPLPGRRHPGSYRGEPGA